MSHWEVALVSLMAGVGVALVCVMFVLLSDLATSTTGWVRRRGRPPCVVCREATLPDDPEYCVNHAHLRVLRSRSRYTHPMA